ncbi:MAG: hypothetical protein ACC628_24695, partial [Pirellulaceae bacterium]
YGESTNLRSVPETCAERSVGASLNGIVPNASHLEFLDAPRVRVSTLDSAILRLYHAQSTRTLFPFASFRVLHRSVFMIHG